MTQQQRRDDSAAVALAKKRAAVARCVPSRGPTLDVSSPRTQNKRTTKGRGISVAEPKNARGSAKKSANGDSDLSNKNQSKQ